MPGVPSEIDAQPETVEQKPRRTLSGAFFKWLASRLENHPKGRQVVGHVVNRIGFYSQAWSFTLTIALVVFLRCTVVTAFYIPSPSMLDTLKIYDRVFVFRLAYWFEKPHLGDIVVFKVPEDIPDYQPDKPIWIKRIVGVGGDHVEIIENHLVVNGKKVTDPPFFRRNPYFAKLQNHTVFRGMDVPPGHVLVFGDNSDNSYDGRYWGPIPEDRIIGKAFVRFWPLSRLGGIHGESVNPLPPGA
jgi:signal peptidase I